MSSLVQKNPCYILKSVTLENGHDRYRLLRSCVPVRIGVPPVRSQNLLRACCCSSCSPMDRLSSEQRKGHPADRLRNAQRDHHLPSPCSVLACNVYDPAATNRMKTC